VLAPEPSAFGLVGVCLLLGIPFARSQRRKIALVGPCAWCCVAGWVWQVGQSAWIVQTALGGDPAQEEPGRNRSC
jgi:hypothetical protein